MWLLDHSCATPAENLSLDEALLHLAEIGRGDEVLRFWESPASFVVVGLSQAVDEHVFREVCARDGVPILRRCSAGGCVLQGAGCLNYSLVLRTDRPGCAFIHSSYRTILGALSSTLQSVGIHVSPAGISDLALGDRKVSGSAQRRRSKHFLHHGTLLYAFEAGSCAKYLKQPRDQPEYRSNRTHEMFLANLNTDAIALRRAVSTVFQATELIDFRGELAETVGQLARQKYSQSDWNFRK